MREVFLLENAVIQNGDERNETCNHLLKIRKKRRIEKSIFCTTVLRVIMLFKRLKIPPM